MGQRYPFPNIPVQMVIADLGAVPPAELPPSCALRGYQAGDEPLWEDIQRASDPYNNIQRSLFYNEFGRDASILAKRQIYLSEYDEVIGTGTAWWAEHDPVVGRIHWVAIRPEQQGRGLGEVLVRQLCAILHEHDHRGAVLDTSAWRIPAINLYLKLGFVPRIEDREEAMAWVQVRPYLRYWPEHLA